MDTAQDRERRRVLLDEYGNQHCLGDELARGGQGVVFRTQDADLAIKQPLDANGLPNPDSSLRERLQNIRILPLPPGIPVSLPLATLRDEPGYVMRLLNGMRPFADFDLNGRTREGARKLPADLPDWLKNSADVEFARRLDFHAKTGSTRARLRALCKCAAILARLHSVGVVYGDISDSNAFFGQGPDDAVWLIDADNMRFELRRGGASAFTPGYGAPEVVAGIDGARARSDCWSFAVMAFKLLALCHPFVGRRVLEPEAEPGGWDDENPDESSGLEAELHAGRLPFVDDATDDSNRVDGGLPRDLVLTKRLRMLFQETLGAGRLSPWRRVPMSIWAMEFAKAFDLSLECPSCRMTYFAEDNENCPYCGQDRPAFLRVKTPRWRLIIPADCGEYSLPHRLFHAFSLEHCFRAEQDVIVGKDLVPARGAGPIPPEVEVERVGVNADVKLTP